MGLLELIGYSLLVIAAAGTVFGGTLYRHAPHRGPLLGYTLGVSLVATLWALFAGIAYIRGGMGLGYDFFYRACWVGWFGIPLIYGLV
ncbi:MAG TPA: hypothetical protein VFR01_05465, partial [Geobacterales bacterium]|nr:hypothetical protein [Geobacterales bacterium]